MVAAYYITAVRILPEAIDDADGIMRIHGNNQHIASISDRLEMLGGDVASRSD